MDLSPVIRVIGKRRFLMETIKKVEDRFRVFLNCASKETIIKHDYSRVK